MKYLTLVVQTDGVIATTYAMKTLHDARDAILSDLDDVDVTRVAILDTESGEIVEQIGKGE